MKNLLRKLFRSAHKNDVVQFVESQYCAVINDAYNWFPTKGAMLKGIEEYSRVNTIYSLTMFRYDMFNLMK